MHISDNVMIADLLSRLLKISEKLSIHDDGAEDYVWFVAVSVVYTAAVDNGGGRTGPLPTTMNSSKCVVL